MQWHLGHFHTPATWRALRFLAVGAVGTVVDISLFIVLHGVLGMPTLPANVLSYSAGILNNYFLHRHWTFAPVSWKSFGLQFAQFVIVSVSALILNTALVLALSDPLNDLLGADNYSNVVAKLLATGVAVGWNFVVNANWTFRPAPKGSNS